MLYNLYLRSRCKFKRKGEVVEKSRKDTSAIMITLGVVLTSIITTQVSAVCKNGEMDETSYEVFVDYGQTLQQMIAHGRYDYVDSDISASNFPTQGSGQKKVVVEIVNFGRDMSSEEVLKEFEARGLRAATLPELLAFGATYPEKQREFSTIALGSVWQDRDGRSRVPMLRRSDFWERRLYLYWYGSDWFDSRFAAVYK